MNEDTKFILRRMEALEGRIMRELKELHAWKNKVTGIYVGIGLISGGIGSLVAKLIKHI